MTSSTNETKLFECNSRKFKEIGLERDCILVAKPTDEKLQFSPWWVKLRLAFELFVNRICFRPNFHWSECLLCTVKIYQPMKNKKSSMVQCHHFWAPTLVFTPARVDVFFKNPGGAGDPLELLSPNEKICLVLRVFRASLTINDTP